MVVGAGLFLLLINLPLRRAGVGGAPAPVIVREGLIVQGSGPELYIFKDYTLHPLTNPTPLQRSQAQQVTDSFLGRYTHGELVDAQGQPVAPVAPQLGPEPSPRVTRPAPISPISVLGALLGIIAVVLGGAWLFIQLSRHSQRDPQPQLEAYRREAGLYLGRIEQLLETRSGKQQPQLQGQVRQWQQVIEALIQTIAHFHQNELIHRDLAEVPLALAALERQLDSAVDPSLRVQLEQTLAQRRAQQAILEQLQTTATQAEIQIERTIALLGTLYSQLLANQSSLHIAGYSHWLREVDEQVHCLQDYLEALREVKIGG
jgi:hypothetical protein